MKFFLHFSFGKFFKWTRTKSSTNLRPDYRGPGSYRPWLFLHENPLEINAFLSIWTRTISSDHFRWPEFFTKKCEEFSNLEHKLQIDSLHDFLLKCASRISEPTEAIETDPQDNEKATNHKKLLFFQLVRFISINWF